MILYCSFLLLRVYLIVSVEGYSVSVEGYSFSVEVYSRYAYLCL